MIDFEVKAVIDRPVNEVFAYVTDPAKLATWQTNTVAAEQLDGGTLRRGGRLREVHRGPGGRELVSTVEVTELEQNRVFALHVLEGTLPIDARIAFEAWAGGTLLRLRAYGQPRGAMRIAQPLLRPVLKRQFAGYCAKLKQLLETQSS
jgi:uncharacterized protein YndB with AHSA1/START domain